MQEQLNINNGRIDILNKQELKCWSELLCCTEEDLTQAVLTIGNAAKLVDTYLYLNRKKQNIDK
ncbi:MAG: hypothetical protein A3F72_13950 [Bacteroidetes bacterium RIFCSPLOWO2_12_FULL_35_15]|nr:MAG: hypothetical protein A3F72_13950 [Bacteroidetes bacterium RIFCSPLOWO2_12_FULL_35_15]